MFCCSSQAKAVRPIRAPGPQLAGGEPSQVVLPVTPMIAADAGTAERARRSKAGAVWSLMIGFLARGGGFGRRCSGKGSAATTLDKRQAGEAEERRRAGRGRLREH